MKKVSDSSTSMCNVGSSKLLRCVLVVLLVSVSAYSIVSCQVKPSFEGRSTVEVWLISSSTEVRKLPDFVENGRNVECMVVTCLVPDRSEPLYVPLSFIKGFDYHLGYEYQIEVIVTQLNNPPQDSSNITYTLKRIISKNKHDKHL